jgi:hypothetical protein
LIKKRAMKTALTQKDLGTCIWNKRVLTISRKYIFFFLATPL